MLYRTPRMTGSLASQLAELDELRRRLGDRTGVAGSWLGRLRRQVRAATAWSSVAIEGFTVPSDDAVALVAGEATPPPGDEDRLAVACYARAMDHVGTMAMDQTFRWLDRVILDLHFDACLFQADKRPGLWREGGVLVTAEGGGIAFRGPDGHVELMGEVVDWLDHGDLEAHVVVRAAMAHLHLVSVHPFQDGNGRISRIVQSLVLALDGLLAPEFNSIEEYLGGHTAQYYNVLTEVQRGSYQPDRDAKPWVSFCIAAHLDQARLRLRQIETAAARWRALEELAEGRRWPDRLVIALEQALTGGADRASYVTEADVSAPTASSDFRRLVDAGLVEQRGKGRSTRYLATQALREAVENR
jgi:hypothetical protein